VHWEYILSAPSTVKMTSKINLVRCALQLLDFFFILF
jgi:hypothetical protein